MKKHNILLFFFSILLITSGLKAATTNYLLQISSSEQGSVKVYRLSGVEVKNNESVTEGETLRLFASCKDENYIFDHFTIENGSPATMETETKGTFIVGKGKVVIKTFFAGKPQTVSFAEPNKEQGSYNIIWNGKALKNGDKVPYGSTIAINSLPKDGFITQTIKTNNESLVIENNSATVEVKKDLAVEVLYTEKAVTVSYLNKVGTGVTLNIYDGETLVKPKSQVAYGTKLYFELVSSSYNFKLIINKNIYPTEDVKVNTYGYTLIAKEDLEITVKDVYSKNTSSLYILTPTQTEIYDGQPKEYNQFNPSVSSLRKEYEITYKKTGETNFTEQTPTEIGAYKVRIFRAADRYYYESKNETATLKIDPAPVTIKTLPVVSLSEGNLILSGGVAESKSQIVKGEFQLKSNDIPSVSKVIEAVFIPENENYTSASCWIPCVIENLPLEKYSIRQGELPPGVEISFMNGNQLVSNDSKVAVGTTLTLAAVKTPRGKQIKEFINQLDETSYEVLTQSIIISKDLKISVTLDDIEALQNITLQESKVNQTLKYTGKSQIFSYAGLGSLPSNKVPDYKYWIFSYTDRETGKQVDFPKNIGVYDVNIYYPQTSQVYELNEKGTLTITSINPTVKELETLKTSEVIAGQTLGNSIITGGNANVTGKIVWKDPSKKVIENAGYEVLFIPDDKNYNILQLPNLLTVPLVNDISKMAISIYAEHGDIVVFNKTTNKQIISGEILSFGDELTIKAEPVPNYKLKSLMINGQTVLNGTTYTVGLTPPAILAEFEVKTINPGVDYHTVTIPSVIGAIVGNIGTSEVPEGSSFSFTIDYDLLYGAPQVTAGGKSLAYDGAYTYTIGQVTQDTTVSIILPKFGYYKTNVIEDILIGAIQVERADVETKTESDLNGYPYGTLLKLTVTPVDGVNFRSWWDGQTDNPREYRIRSNMDISAKYTGTPTDNIEIDTNKRVWSVNQTIFINLDKKYTVQVIDMQGQIIRQEEITGQHSFHIAQSGIYIVVVCDKKEAVIKQKVVLK